MVSAENLTPFIAEPPITGIENLEPVLRPDREQAETIRTPVIRPIATKTSSPPQ
jgi:hypothetical protein